MICPVQKYINFLTRGRARTNDCCLYQNKWSYFIILTNNSESHRITHFAINILWRFPSFADNFVIALYSTMHLDRDGLDIKLLFRQMHKEISLKIYTYTTATPGWVPHRKRYNVISSLYIRPGTFQPPSLKINNHLL